MNALVIKLDGLCSRRRADHLLALVKVSAGCRCDDLCALFSYLLLLAKSRTH
jgi:hypothetical protein